MRDRHPRGARLSLNVKVSPGSDFNEACQSAMYVADTLEVTVLFNFNETAVFVVPGDSQKAINQRWDAARTEKPIPQVGSEAEWRVRGACEMNLNPYKPGQESDFRKDVLVILNELDMLRLARQ